MTDLQEINFDLHYPRGPGELAMQRSKEGLHISRRFAAMMTGKLGDAWLPVRSGKTLEQTLQIDTRGSGDEEDKSTDDPNP